MVDLAANRNQARRFVIDIEKTLDAQTRVDKDDRIDPHVWSIHPTAKFIPPESIHPFHQKKDTNTVNGKD